MCLRPGQSGSGCGCGCEVAPCRDARSRSKGRRCEPQKVGESGSRSYRCGVGRIRERDQRCAPQRVGVRGACLKESGSGGRASKSQDQVGVPQRVGVRGARLTGSGSGWHALQVLAGRPCRHRGSGALMGAVREDVQAHGT